MGTALSLLVVMTVLLFAVRVAAVALRLTGLGETAARFQALSAISGAGFTTKESESIVNYPVRRQIVSILIIIGNLGLVTVMATMVVSLVQTEGEIGAVLVQVGWLLGVTALLWFLMLNKKADRIMCDLIARILISRTLLGKRTFSRIAQIGDGFSVAEHPVTKAWIDAQGELDAAVIEELGLMVLAVRDTEGELVGSFSSIDDLKPGYKLVLYGSDPGHEALEARGHHRSDAEVLK